MMNRDQLIDMEILISQLHLNFDYSYSEIRPSVIKYVGVQTNQAEEDHGAGAINNPTALSGGNEKGGTQLVPDIPHCNCGNKAVMKDAPNNRRKFFVCGKSRQEQCNFFRWLAKPIKTPQLPENNCDHSPSDPTSEDDSPPVRDGQEINCDCGQPAAQRTVQNKGVNKGRSFFSCSKPQGEQCEYFQWAEEIEEGPSQGHQQAEGGGVRGGGTCGQGDDGQGGQTNFGMVSNEPVVQCILCQAQLALKSKQSGGWMISCQGYPACQAAPVLLPSSVKEASVDQVQCNGCNNHPKHIKLVCTRGTMAPFFSDTHTGCLGGCDEDFLEVLGIDKLNNGNLAQAAPRGEGGGGARAGGQPRGEVAGSGAGAGRGGTSTRLTSRSNTRGALQSGGSSRGGNQDSERGGSSGNDNDGKPLDEQCNFFQCLDQPKNNPQPQRKKDVMCLVLGKLLSSIV